MSSSLLLAVDGGNSKTDVAVCTTDGDVLGWARGPGSSAQLLGVPGSLATVAATRHAISTARAAGPLLAAAYAMSGLDLATEEQAYAEAVAGQARYVTACNDIFALLRVGTDDGVGIAVVAGAGINCVGVAADGRQIRFHSLGRLTGDWGGGIDLGEEAVGAACRDEDGRGPRTSLRDAVAAHFGVEQPLQVAEAVHRGELARPRLAELAPSVMAASDAGDAVAGSLLDRLGTEVAAFVLAAAARLAPITDPLPVVLGGGLLRVGNARLTTRIHTLVSEALPAAVLSTPAAAPVVGSALLAADLAGLSGAVQRRLRSALSAATARG